ncbi:MAG: hypothetical protein H6711_01080 [Myxococcales bacterium]|nr:hypothetical protein [Myxococcales bacterium]
MFKRPSTSLAFLPALALAMMAGCDEPAGFGEDGAVKVRPWGCTWCGSTYGNSPIISNAEVSDIHLDLVSTGGVKLWPGTTLQGRPFKLDIDPITERFLGLDPSDPDVVEIKDDQFLGAKIALEMNGGAMITLTITDYDDKVPSWSSDGGTITAYKAAYMGPDEQMHQLCPSTSPENQWFTLIADELYDRTDHTVSASPRSVSIACVGEAAAKMKLMDFGPHGGRGASLDERQATLRMITADYCGTGVSFTASGTQVAWRDYMSLVEPPTDEVALEAYWTKDGAYCLNTPRHAELAEVLEECSIPTCTDDVGFSDGVIWRTMLPNTAD